MKANQFHGLNVKILGTFFKPIHFYHSGSVVNLEHVILPLFSSSSLSYDLLTYLIIEVRRKIELILPDYYLTVINDSESKEFNDFK